MKKSQWYTFSVLFFIFSMLFFLEYFGWSRGITTIATAIDSKSAMMHQIAVMKGILYGIMANVFLCLFIIFSVCGGLESKK